MSDKTFEIVKPLKNQLPHCNNKWLDSVKMYLYHTTGGVSYFNNQEYPAGWYISFSPVHIEKYDTYQTTSTELFHKRAFKMHCNDASRFSAKRFEKLSKLLEEHADEMAKLYDEQKDTELFVLVKSIFGEVK